jgi:ribosomal protein L27
MKQKINEIEVNGVQYVRKDSTNLSPNYTGDIKIVVLQRGWVFIGRFERDGNNCKLHNAYNIRQWGTTKGLGELVNGSTDKTILDKCEGVVEFDWLTTVCVITVNQSKWNMI